MNILVLSWRGPGHPLAGGAEQVMHEHMKGWSEKGHKITLFTSSFPEARSNELIDGINIIRQGNQILGVHFSAFIWYVFNNHKKYDLIVDQFHGIPFFSPLYAKTSKLAVVQEVAGKVWLENDLPKPWNIIVGYLGYYAERFVYMLYKNVSFITGSKSAKEDLISVGIPPKNITVIPHGVIIQKPKRIFPKEKLLTVIFLGALSKDKGIEDAIRAFGILNKKGKYQFWVVGKGGEEYQKFLSKLAKKLNIENKLTFWGFVSQEKKFELLMRAHVMVNPSLLEGWGLVNIEANAVATPVVAYTSRGLVDSVKDGQSGILCNRNTPDELATQVDLLLHNNKMLSLLQKESINWSKQFSWKKSKDSSVKLIENIHVKK